ncbi:MAG TPA: recombinase family protein [Alphaproteobacteria bacterium]|nr:recombinase family protein [Alphaproteobacteria bacterium]
MGSRVALYIRVSTEDQADRGTIQNQVEFLRNYAKLYGLEIGDEYPDDGISGTIPLNERPGGQRLLADAKRGKFNEVLVYKVDRLGRTLRSLLDAFQELDHHHITIRSVTEPFDTSTAAGRLLFQMLGSLAEFERSNILDRTQIGRDRSIRNGKWVGGPIPFGFMLDDEGYLTPSMRVVPNGKTEAQFVHECYERIVNGETTVSLSRLMNALRIPTARRYTSGKEVIVGIQWLPSRISKMIKNPIYKGVHIYRSKHGVIQCSVPSIVNESLWNEAQIALANNKHKPKLNKTRFYLLRGLIICANCGARYVGTTKTYHNKSGIHQIAYYRCGSQLASHKPDRSDRCGGKHILADLIEGEVWGKCRSYIENPGDALSEARRRLHERKAGGAVIERERKSLQEVLASKKVERERILTLYRRGIILSEEADQQLMAIAKEEGEIRALIESIQMQNSITLEMENYYEKAEVVLRKLRDDLHNIEADQLRKRQAIEFFVAMITIETMQKNGQRKRARITTKYKFSDERAVFNTNSPGSEIYYPIIRAIEV